MRRRDGNGTGIGGSRQEDSGGGFVLPSRNNLPERGLDHTRVRQEERREKVRVENQEITPLNPQFPYTVIGPDVTFFGIDGNIPTTFLEADEES